MTFKPSSISVLLLLLCVSPLTVLSQEREPQRNVVTASQDVNQRYFAKMFELAEHDLQMAEEANKRVPNIISKLTMIQIGNQASYAAMLLQREKKSDIGLLHDVHIRSIENEMKLTKQRLDWAQGIREEQPNIIKEDEVQRLQLQYELSQLALERAKQPGISSDPIRHLQWQIERLQRQLLTVRIQLDRLQYGN